MFFFSSILNDDLWLLNMVLKLVSQIPMYDLYVGLSVRLVTVAL